MIGEIFGLSDTALCVAPSIAGFLVLSTNVMLRICDAHNASRLMLRILGSQLHSVHLGRIRRDTRSIGLRMDHYHGKGELDSLVLQLDNVPQRVRTARIGLLDGTGKNTPRDTVESIQAPSRSSTSVVSQLLVLCRVRVLRYWR